MGPAGGAALGTAGIGALTQGAGGKKAAGGDEPQIPREFRGFLQAIAGPLSQALRQGLPRFGGPLVAGLNPLQIQSQGMAQRLLGSGEQGFMDALRTVQTGAEQGFRQEDLDLARQQLQPLFDFQRRRGIADITEQSALGGRQFGTGRNIAVGDFLAQLEGGFEQQLLPFAQQMFQNRQQAAQSIPGFLAQGLGLAGAGTQIGEFERSIRDLGLTRGREEFIRTQPTSAIPFLAQLMGATPMYQPAVPPNFGQIFGGALTGLAGNQGFLSFLQNAFGSQGVGSVPTPPLPGPTGP